MAAEDLLWALGIFSFVIVILAIFLVAGGRDD